MNRTKKRIQLFGWHDFLNIVRGLFIGKLQKMQSNHYTRKSNQLDFLTKKGIEDLSYTNGMWKINLDERIYYARSDSSDILVFEQVVLDGEYDQFFDQVARSHIGPIRILDLGANIGLTSRVALRKIPKATIIAVEPSAENFRILELNLAGVPGDIRLHNKGIWNKSCRLSVKTDFRGGNSWSLRVEEDPEGSVESLDFGEIVESHRVNVVKMDIEGSEFRIFENEEYVLKAFERVDFIALEVHEEAGDKKKNLDSTGNCWVQAF